MSKLHIRPQYLGAVVAVCILSFRPVQAKEQLEVLGPGLPDFSFAGYRMGADLPDSLLRERVDPRNFGVIADDDRDDSRGLLAAINFAAERGRVVYLGNGVYDFDRPMRIVRGNWVVRGETRTGTVLRFRRPLCDDTQQCEEATSGRKMSAYSVGPGQFQVVGGFRAGPPYIKADIKGEYARGTRTFLLSARTKIVQGQLVTILLKNPADNSLAQALHGSAFHPQSKEYPGRTLVRFTSRVVSISGASLTLERGLPVAIRSAWQAEVQEFLPRVEDIGIENLTIEMRHDPYRGHFREKGFNGISLAGVVNSWISGVSIVNSDLPIHLSDSQFVTVRNIDIEVSSSRGRFSGHHGIWLSSSHDNLFSEFTIGVRSKAKFHHDLSISWYSRGNVFERGAGYDMNLDHHGVMPFQNLFTQIDLGAGSRAYESGGGAGRMPHSGWLNVYWNVQSANFVYPDCDFGGGVLVFVNTPDVASQVGRCSTVGWVYRRDQALPSNLYLAQRTRRLASRVSSEGN